jgi:predicted ester cyclase
MPDKNQANKAKVWDYWQRMNHAVADEIPGIIEAAAHKDVDWNGPQPINQILGVDALVADFWQPLLRSFPDLKRNAYILMGDLTETEEWVSGVGYLTGTFDQDWLDIPATGEKTNIHFGQFYLMREGKIAESYLILDMLAVMRQAGFQVLPPARGREGGKVPGPHTNDGVLLTEQDELVTHKTRQLVRAMGEAHERYDRARDGGNMGSMEHEHYWHPQMHWYGPTGIGSCLSIEEYEDFHQRPWLHGFGDRGLHVTGGGRHTPFLVEGKYGSGGIWDTAFSYHHGEYLGIPATGKLMTMRDFDWYHCEGDLILQNWVPIDIIDLLMQMDIDPFDRLHCQIEQRKREA